MLCTVALLSVNITEMFQYTDFLHRCKSLDQRSHHAMQKKVASDQKDSPIRIVLIINLIRTMIMLVMFCSVFFPLKKNVNVFKQIFSVISKHTFASTKRLCFDVTV